MLTQIPNHKKEILKGKQVLTLAPWGYAVYVR
jgi:hypothetical protein